MSRKSGHRFPACAKPMARIALRRYASAGVGRCEKGHAPTKGIELTAEPTIDQGRRTLIKGAGALACGLLLTVNRSDATPASMQAAIRSVFGNAEIGRGKVTIDIPSLVENGNTVPMTVLVDSPMTATDYVKSIHVFNEKNPQPNVIGIHLGPRAGKASIATRIRLADSQKVVAIAQMSDGSVWSGQVDVIVTLAACVEGL
jgi:sulfur-oxidizing protein SoxY